MSTRTRLPDLEDLFAQGDDREEYVNFSRIMDKLREAHLERLDSDEMLRVRGVATHIVSALLFNDNFFDVMRNMGVVPFYYDPPQNPDEVCACLYVHKSELLEAMLNDRFIHFALNFEYLPDEQIATDQHNVAILRKLLNEMAGTGKTKLQEQNLKMIDEPLYERQARPLVEKMANHFFPTMADIGFFRGNRMDPG